MNKQRLALQVLSLVLVVLFLAACGPGLVFGPTATPTSVPMPRAGQWKGKDVSFTVTKDGTVTDFEIEVVGCQITLEDSILIDPSISFGSFAINPEGAFRGEKAETATDFSAEATFGSASTLDGVLTVQICGGSMLFGQTDVAWTAEWQGQ